MIKTYGIDFYKGILKITGHNDYSEEELKRIITPHYQAVMNKKCIVFARVSTPTQDLDQQVESLKKNAELLGYTPENIIIIKMKESGISLSEEERLGINKLKKTILDDSDIDTVLCWEISRIARRADIIYSMRDFFKEHKIRWIILTPYIELIDKEGKDNQTASLLLAVFTSFAESEMNIKKERAKRVVEYRKSLNKFAGGKVLLGYKVDKENNFIIDNENADIVIKIFNMYSTGLYSYRSLAKELKEIGYFENVSNHSLPSRLNGYINDERYTGHNKAYPQIIDTELFNKCQEISKKNNIISKPDNPTEMLCKGLIFSKSRKVALIPGFGKGVYSIHPDYGPPCLTITAKYIDKLILDYTQEQINKYLCDERKIEEEYFKSQKILFKRIYSITKEQTKIEERISRAEELYIDGNITKEKLDKKVKTLREEYANNKEYITKMDNQYRLLEQNYINNKPVILNDISFNEQRKYVLQFIERIEIEKEKPLARRSKVYIHNKYDNKVYVYLLYSQNSKYEKKCKKPELIDVI